MYEETEAEGLWPKLSSIFNLWSVKIAWITVEQRMEFVSGLNDLWHLYCKLVNTSVFISQRYGVCCVLFLKCLHNRMCYFAVLGGTAITLMIASQTVTTCWTWQFSYIQHLAAEWAFLTTSRIFSWRSPETVPQIYSSKGLLMISYPLLSSFSAEQ